MKFIIEVADEIDIPDVELSSLLKEVYVGGGYVEAEYAEALFESSAIRSRGTIITASHADNKRLAGLVIMVPPTSNASKLAKHNEVEVHLLAVKQEYRKNSLGEQLVDELILRAMDSGYKKIILWTQESMLAAQNLYSKLGFFHKSNFEANGRKFYLYERVL
jgi:ribosomal protein S18 acetylase RimI-like enzyme